MLPPLLVQLLLIRHNPDPDVGYELATTRFQICMAFLKQLGDIYWHASFYYEFLELAASSSQPTSHLAEDSRKTVSKQTTGHRSSRRPQQRRQEAPLDLATEDHGQEALAVSVTSPDAFSDPSIEAANGDALGGNVMDTEGLALGENNGLFEDWLGDHWLDEHELFRTMFPSA